MVLIASSFGPTLALSALPASLTQTFASARRLFALMDESPVVEETGTATPAYIGMALEHVRFAYPDRERRGDAAHDGSLTSGDRQASDHSHANEGASGQRSDGGVFSDLSLDIPAYGILGVQGPSGRGKSTMLKLLMRYWDPQSGRVTMSGEDLRAVDAHHRRRVQALLAQETYLFDGTIRENLMLAFNGRDAGGAADAVSGAGTASATGAEDMAALGSGASGAQDPFAVDALLRDALAKASALQLVDSLPDGLDTPVGELGGRLSEGERQRIGLARVFLRQADLVLLDEPTSRLDAFNEAVILQSINALAGDTSGAAADGVDSNGSRTKGAAIVLVSHRDSTMRVADSVIHV